MREVINEFLIILQRHVEVVELVGDRIEQKENYMDELKAYLPSLQDMITTIFDLIQNPQIQLDIAPQFVLQVLNDIIYGIEQEDSVFLLDVLRYGLLEVYYYIGTELQSEGSHE